MLNNIKKFGNLIFFILIFIYLYFNNNFKLLFNINYEILFLCIIISILIILINTQANRIFINLFGSNDFFDILKITSINSISNFIFIGSGVLANSIILKNKYGIEIKKFAVFSFHKSLISFIVFTPPALLLLMNLNVYIFFLILIIQIITVYIFFSKKINLSYFNFLGKYLSSVIINFQNYRNTLFKLNTKLFFAYFLNYLLSSLIFYLLFISFNIDMPFTTCFLFVSLINISKFFLITFLDIGIGEFIIGLLYFNNIDILDIIILIIISQKFIHFFSSVVSFTFSILINKNNDFKIK